jgi:undecaprenyl-diphosphatase
MNEQIFFNLYSLAHQSCFLDKIIILFAEYLPYLLVFWVLVYAFKNDFGKFDFKNPFKIVKKRFSFIFNMFFPALAGWVIVSFLKGVVSYPRPFVLYQEIVRPLFVHGGMDSFPSGHAAFFGALALSAFLVDKKMGYWVLLASILIGVGRIISGVHFPIDILIGYLIGLLVVLLFYLFSNIRHLKK